MIEGETNPIVKLSLRHCGITADAARRIGGSLGNAYRSLNSKLITLNLAGNPLGDEGAIGLIEVHFYYHFFILYIYIYYIFESLFWCTETIKMHSFIGFGNEPDAPLPEHVELRSGRRRRKEVWRSALALLSDARSGGRAPPAARRAQPADEHRI